MKHSKSFLRDYEFYNKALNEFSFSGKSIYKIPFSENGASAMDCVHIYDSTGVFQPCAEPELASRIINCKASVNLHIKMYAESMGRGEFQLGEIEDIFNQFDAPKWVIDSVVKQAYKYGWLGEKWNKNRIECVNAVRRIKTNTL